jgi:hypothetical protein
MRKVFNDGSIGNVMRRCADGLKRIRMPLYLADVPVADASIKVYLVAAKALIQRVNQGMSIAIADVSRAIVPHLPISNRDQIAAKGNLTFIDRDAHAGSLDGAPTFIVDFGVIA